MTTPLDSLRAFVARNGGSAAYEGTPGVILVSAGKGGVGTSTVASLLAVAAAARSMRTLLVDGDATLGSVRMFFSVPDTAPGLAALNTGSTPEELAVPVAPNLHLIPGATPNSDAGEDYGRAERMTFYKRISGLYESYEFIVLDAGSYLETAIGFLQAGVERALVVTAPDRVALAGSYALLKTIGHRHPEVPVEVLVNGRSETDARTVFRIIESAAGHFLGVPVTFAGGVPDDSVLRSSMASGSDLAELEGGSPAWNAISSILDRLLFRHQELGGVPTASVLSFPVRT